MQDTDGGRVVAQPRVVVVGAGFGGIGLAGRLLADGVDVTVVEKADGVGGTWRANTYPGAACDIPSHLYSLSFAPKDDWSRVYAPQPEILAYLEDVTDRLGVRPHLRLSTEVLGATWDEATCTWAVELSDGDTLGCEVLVSATGQLNRPLVPRIAGLDAFPGPVVHSARWDHDVELDGARVAVVGTGAAEKPQVQAMLKILLPGAKIAGADAADALAVAIADAHLTKPG